MSLAMPSLAPAAPVAREAASLADANWRANLAALAETQPELAVRLEGESDQGKWIFGRDGALTAQDASGGWWAGCSVPAAAARAMLKSFACTGVVACFLRPPTGAAVRVALGKLRRNQAVIAIVDDVAAARVMLHTESIAGDIRSHRLWLVVGDGWEAQLADLLRRHDGLPTPSQFVRLSDGFEEFAEAMIEPAQRVFTEVGQLRAAALASAVHAGEANRATRGCVIAPTHFRLWDDAGFVLASVASQLGWSHLDPDDPACASPLAVARAATGCAAVVMPNTGRADLPNVVAATTPWITWLTGPRVPDFTAAGSRDALIVAGTAWRDLAIARGWPASRVHVATWPARSVPPNTGGPLLILDNQRPLDPPKDVVEMSSHRLLWEFIADELARDPFAIGVSVTDYLRARISHAKIAAESLNQRRFIDELIAPAFARGLAMLLHREGIPLRVAGEGWDAIAPLARCAAGPIEGRDAFESLIATSSALVHVWPTPGDHPIDFAGRAVVRVTRGREQFLRDARLAVAGRLAVAPTTQSPLSAELLSVLVAAA